MLAISPRPIEPSAFRAGPTSRSDLRPMTAQRQRSADKHDEDDDDGDHDEFPFPDMRSSICQLFTGIPFEDLARRVQVLNEYPDLLARHHFDTIDAGFLRQSIDFCRVGKHAAIRSCISSLALLRVSKDKNQQQLDEFLHSLLFHESNERREYTEIVKSLSSTVEQEAQRAEPLLAQQPHPPTHSASPRSASLFEEEEVEERVNPTKKVNYHEPSLHSLSKEYRMRTANFFKPGKVFAIPWAEPTREISGIADNVVRGRYGENYFTHIRRMVSIHNSRGACWCVAIHSYGGQGLCKPGFRRADIDAHTIIYDSCRSPTSMSKEPVSAKRPIAVSMASGQALTNASRIHLAQPYTVQHSVKVMEMGQVVADDLDILIAYVKAELFS